MSKKHDDWFDAMIGSFKAEPLIKQKQIKAIDVMELLKHINKTPPESISQVNSIILNQQQYDVTIME